MFVTLFNKDPLSKLIIKWTGGLTLDLESSGLTEEFFSHGLLTWFFQWVFSASIKTDFFVECLIKLKLLPINLLLLRWQDNWLFISALLKTKQSYVNLCDVYGNQNLYVSAQVQAEENKQERQISPGLAPPPCVVLLWLQAQEGGHFEIAAGGEWIVRWGLLLLLPTLSGWWSPLCTKTPLALSSINREGVRTFLSLFQCAGVKRCPAMIES